MKTRTKTSIAFLEAILVMPISYQFKEKQANVGTLLGVQNKVGKNGFWNVGFGVGMSITQNKTNLGAIGELSLGLILNSTDDSAKPRMSKQELKAPKSR